jgi:hypothetical protein
MWPKFRTVTHGIREIIVGAHVTEKEKIGYVLLSLPKMAIWERGVKGLAIRKIGLVKSSSV